MEGGRPAFFRRPKHLVVALNLVTREVLVVVVWLKRFRFEYAPREPHGSNQHAAVDLFGQIARLDFRLLERIGRANPHIAFAFWPLLPWRGGHAGFCFELALHAFEITRRRECELNIGGFQMRLGFPEAVDLRR